MQKTLCNVLTGRSNRSSIQFNNIRSYCTNRWVWIKSLDLVQLRLLCLQSRLQYRIYLHSIFCIIQNYTDTTTTTTSLFLFRGVHSEYCRLRVFWRKSNLDVCKLPHDHLYYHLTNLVSFSTSCLIQILFAHQSYHAATGRN